MVNCLLSFDVDMSAFCQRNKTTRKEEVTILVILHPAGWLHVDTFRFCVSFIWGIYSTIDSPKTIGKFLRKSPHFNRCGYFSISTSSSVTNRRFSPSPAPPPPAMHSNRRGRKDRPPLPHPAHQQLKLPPTGPSLHSFWCPNLIDSLVI
jgi:hypothetical protein